MLELHTFLQTYNILVKGYSTFNLFIRQLIDTAITFCLMSNAALNICVQVFVWLSEEALQIAEKRREAKGKGEKEKYTHLNAEFQRTARRDKKAFLSDQC